MIKFFFILILLVYLSSAFKDCSKVTFCSSLRTRTPHNKYEVDTSGINLNDIPPVIIIPLIATDGSSNLTVSIYNLENNAFRIKFKEDNSTRYELKDVLVKEPVVTKFSRYEITDSYLSLQLGENKIVVGFSPFRIEGHKNDVFEIVFNLDNKFTFESSLGQAFAFSIRFPQAKQIYGIHEHTDNLALQNTSVGGSDPYRLRNLDSGARNLYSTTANYGSIPVLYGHGPEVTAGIFLHNAAEQWFEITNGEESSEAYIMVESGTLDLFMLLGPTPVEVVRQYTELTGTAHLPQLWALGYHQSRYTYSSQEDLKDVVANFTKYNFPLDAIWLDIDYTDGKRYFTWNPDTFSDPVEMQQNISATNKRLVTIIDPHIKVENGYNVYDGALKNDLFVKNADGSNFEGDCWPGLSSYIDFLNPDARTYFGNFYSYDNFPSTTPVLAGIWNDMNEPSIFNEAEEFEATFPGDVIHFGGVVNRDIHNIYGLLHTMSTHQGLLERDNGTKRPFILSRSHFAGSQRYAAIWTGDNDARWDSLKISYAECLNSNILGLVFCGADVGGFSSEPSTELLQRWYQAGIWLPFFRVHSDLNTKRREPYLFDENVQEVIRNAMQLRYKHLPVWYTLFYEHTRYGDPIIRPFFYHYPSDENVFGLTDHLLVGRDILVRAVTEEEVTSVQVYFPGGSEEKWLSIDGSSVYAGNGYVSVPVDIQAIPVFYRKGSVIVTKETVRLSTDEMKNDGYTLYLNLGDGNKATSTVYLDDNTSFNYLNNKEYNYIKIDGNETDVLLTKIDVDAVDSGLSFIVEEVIINKIEKSPKNGESGTYKKKIYKHDFNQNLLKNLKIELNKPFNIKLLK